ncbi:ALK and LTK ligand 1 isoform X1 [Ranitomeya variabilis]|uniref:ALK and LTK ligand 1 isoform X1 n=1 Tax=Ranitomeya variabilis TaxID=490064 RepID=UPI004055C6F9
MQRARKWQAVLAISFLLVTSSVHGISEAQERERRILLDLIVQAIGDSNTSRESAGKVITRRYSEGTAYSSEHGGHRRLSSRERASPRTSRKRPSDVRRPWSTVVGSCLWRSCGVCSCCSKIFSRDSTLKEKFINHFTEGPVVVSAECSKQFYRLYHNTKDCSTPIHFKRCARLLTRMAKSPLCSQP